MGESTFVKYHPTREAAEQEGQAFCQRLGRGYSPRYRVYKALGHDHWTLEVACWNSCD